MYNVSILNGAKRDIKKLDKPIQQDVLDALKDIGLNPFLGEKLKGKFHEYWSYHSRCQNVDYRIVYEILEDKILVEVIMVGTRENFYKELTRRV